MDEPQLTSEVEIVEANTEKPDLNEVLESAFAESDSEKAMEVDNIALGEEPSTSAEVAVSETISDDVESPVYMAASEEDAGENVVIADESPAADNNPKQETVEHVSLDKGSELDETTNTETDQLNFNERSLNFSQLNVEHEDDSNDAFNALKESETDALQTPKEESDELKEADGDSNDSKERGKTDAAEVIEVDPVVSVEQIETEQSAAESTVVEDNSLAPAESEGDENNLTTPTEKESDEFHAATTTADLDCEDNYAATSTADLDFDIDGDNDVMTSEPAAEIEDEDGTTETTNEGEGVDEDVCLLGDETDINEVEAEKELEEPVSEKEVSSEIETTSESAEIVDQEAPRLKLPESTEVENDDVDSQSLKENEIREIVGLLVEQSCLNCENTSKCGYKLLEESGDTKYLCTFNCVKEHQEDNPDKYSLTQKKIIIDEVASSDQENVCSKCEEMKLCKYRYSLKVFSAVTTEAPAAAEGEEESEVIPEVQTETVESTETKYICSEDCLISVTTENADRYVVKPIVETAPEPTAEVEEVQEIPKIVARSDAMVEAARLDREQSFIRKCTQCYTDLSQKATIWETLDFCNEKCLGLYQNMLGAACVQCNEVVSLSSIGKLCVRFGSEPKQFCSSSCLNDFKKSYHPCSLCSKNLKTVADDVISTKRGKSFCDEQCAKTYDTIINPRKNRSPYLCSVCNSKKSPEVVALLDGDIHRFCSNPCFSAFKFVNNVVPDQCEMCTKYFERKSADASTLYQGDTPKIFCTEICKNIFITKNREIWKCDWCKVSKYNYDMIQPIDGKNPMCSLNCLSLHEVSINAISRKHADCDHCEQQKQPQYHLTMSDASIRNFCTYQCVLGFQSQFSKARALGEMPSVVPAGTAKRITPARVGSANFDKQPVPVISRVQSLNLRRGGRKPYNPIANRRLGSPIPVPELTVQLERLSDLPARVKVSSLSSLMGGPSGWSSTSSSSSVRVEHKTQVVTIPPLPKLVGNKSTMCKAITLNKAINCVPATAEAECQTEDWLEQRIIVPVPIVVYVPQPMMMYSLPTPVAVPFVLPIPVPVFVPTTRNSASGIMKEIKKIQEKMPTDPYEAELLMMAEMVAGDKKREETDSDSDENNEIEYGDGLENNSSFNEDLVQMAFKMAGNDFDDPPVDLENEMTANTIQSSNAFGDDMDPHSLQHHQLLLLQQQRDAVASMQSNRGRKRMQQPVKPTNNRNVTPSKRIKREMEVMQPEMPREPAEKPDANMCLKYTFGVNAWKQWVATKNADFEKSSIRRKPIKSEILQLTADELNYSLCMFVKEVRKPNGSEYAPDTIYYLVLGIQQYLYENGRIDNIFTDRYYEQFTDCLDEVAKKFSVLYNDSQYIVTRVEEEHLWECKQLGAHSPHVLLSTLMFFNTKHFNLVTVDEHMELSFSHIMKHWKRNPNQPGAAKVPGSRNVLLRFYPPQSSLEANSRKKKVYEQQENEENPLRCPVKLYEFYLSKCPESVKTRNDVFYLQPERSCVPDSPVWYSTQPLSRDALTKCLHRVKMVKEINIALLTS